MTPDKLREAFESEQPHHPEWSVSSFGMVLSPTLMALLELYARHPQSRRSVSDLRHTLHETGASQPRIRPPDIRPRALTPFKGLDQKRLASGEKPDDDE